MFRWSKSSKVPAPAGAGAVGGEVAVQKVERIEYLNLVPIRAPVRGGVVSNQRKPQPPPAAASAAKKPDSPRVDDINWRAGRFIEDTKKRWSLGHM